MNVRVGGDRVVADFPSPISQVPQRISQTSIVNALSDGHFNAAFTDRKKVPDRLYYKSIQIAISYMSCDGVRC